MRPYALSYAVKFSKKSDKPLTNCRKDIALPSSRTWKEYWRFRRVMHIRNWWTFNITETIYTYFCKWWYASTIAIILIEWLTLNIASAIGFKKSSSSSEESLIDAYGWIIFMSDSVGVEQENNCDIAGSSANSYPDVHKTLLSDCG